MPATASQRAAIECDEHLIIFAGPGSGKTSTSIQKACRILSDPARRLILCTFSVQAAVVLRVRLEKAFARNGQHLPSDRVHIGTLDSLSLRHLQNYMRRNGHRELNLLAPNLQGPMLWRMVSELGVQFDEVAPWLERYQSAISRESVVRRMKEESEDAVLLVNAYIERLKAGGLVDLATVKRTCALNMDKGIMPPFEVKGQPATDFLIDEVQDSDELQLLMARTMADAGAITTLVGDDDQTIYAWRNACGYKGMTDFIKHTKAQVVRLGENFRSHSEIVQVSTQLIAFNNPDRVDKQQRSMRGPGGNAACLSFEDPNAELSWVCEDIQARNSERMASGQAMPVSRAILARRNIVLNAAEVYLRGAGIPYFRTGPSLWDRMEVVNYLQLLNFTACDVAEGLAIVLSALQVSGGTIDGVLRVLRNHEGTTLESMELEQIHGASELEMIVLRRVFTTIDMWRDQLKDQWVTRVIDDSAEALVQWLRMDLALSKGTKSKNKDRNKELIGYAHDALLLRKGTLEQRLRDMTRQREKTPPEDAVRIMTMHASKGLEFDSVYLVDCSEREPDTTMTSASDERRVLYVGMTRAERYLRVTFSGKMPVFMKEAKLQLIMP